MGNRKKVQLEMESGNMELKEQIGIRPVGQNMKREQYYVVQCVISRSCCRPEYEKGTILCSALCNIQVMP